MEIITIVKYKYAHVSSYGIALMEKKVNGISYYNRVKLRIS